MTATNPQIIMINITYNTLGYAVCIDNDYGIIEKDQEDGGDDAYFLNPDI